MISQRLLWCEIPQGYEKSEYERRRAVVSEGLEEIFSAQVFDSSLRSVETSSYQGRAPIAKISLPGGGAALVRTYHHGGLRRFCSGKLFFTWPPRPFRELAITVELRHRGIPTVDALAAGIERVAGPLYRGWFASREIEGARDLWAAFESGWARAQGVEVVLQAVAASLQLLHRQGVCHGDLNLKNILLRREDEELKAYIIDLDKASLFLGPVPAKIANGNLARLLRSVRKLDAQRRYLSENDWNKFISCYYGARS